MRRILVIDVCYNDNNERWLDNQYIGMHHEKSTQWCIPRLSCTNASWGLAFNQSFGKSYPLVN